MPVFLPSTNYAAFVFRQGKRIPVRLSCDRCGKNPQEAEYYQCLECTNCGICRHCLETGQACEDQRHRWTECRTNDKGGIDTSRATLASQVKEAGASYPAMFEPQNSTDTPSSLFTRDLRFICRNDSGKILIYTDGACPENGQSYARGGYAFVHGPSIFSHRTGTFIHAIPVSGRLESRGPTGETYQPTSNRAELRAVIAALQYRDWSTDFDSKWTGLVIATVSDYVALGATTWIKNWESNGWKSSDGDDVKNQDFWKLLLRETRRLQGLGVSTEFWRIPREWNQEADKSAKEAATLGEVIDFRGPKPDGPLKTIPVPYPFGSKPVWNVVGSLGHHQGSCIRIGT